MRPGSAFPKRTPRLRRQIGGQHRHGRLLQKTGKFRTALVELMIAQRHGVPRHNTVHLRNHGPLVHAVKKRALKLITGVERNHVVPVPARRLHGRSHAPESARAVPAVQAGVAAAVHARKKGMRVVGVQNNKLQSVASTIRRSALRRTRREQKRRKQRRRHRQRPLFPRAPHELLPPAPVLPPRDTLLPSTDTQTPSEAITHPQPDHAATARRFRSTRRRRAEARHAAAHRRRAPERTIQGVDAPFRPQIHARPTQPAPLRPVQQKQIPPTQQHHIRLMRRLNEKSCKP